MAGRFTLSGVRERGEAAAQSILAGVLGDGQWSRWKIGNLFVLPTEQAREIIRRGIRALDDVNPPRERYQPAVGRALLAPVICSAAALAAGGEQFASWNELLAALEVLDAATKAALATARDQWPDAPAAETCRGPMTDGTVYFIRQPSTGAVKIGWTRDLARRLDDLRTANADALEVIGAWPGSVQDEREAHRAFAEHRISGEWFRPADAVLAAARDGIAGIQQRRAAREAAK